MRFREFTFRVSFCYFMGMFARRLMQVPDSKELAEVSGSPSAIRRTMGEIQ